MNYAAMTGPVGQVIPDAVSRDPEFMRLVRTIQGWQNSGRLSADDALASIAELVDFAVEASFMPGGETSAEIAASDTDEAGEDEFERRREAGTSFEKKVLA